MAEPIIVWFRQDLRLHDNPALAAAAAARRPIIPVYIFSPEEAGDWPPGAASRWWLHHALAALAAELERRGSRLILARGPSQPILLKLLRAAGAAAVVWNRRYEPTGRARDEHVEHALRAAGCEVNTFNSALLVEPGELLSQSGMPYLIFTPYYKAWMKRIGSSRSLWTPPRRLAAPAAWPTSLAIEKFALLPRAIQGANWTADWTHGLRAAWGSGSPTAPGAPGEAGARAQLDCFLAEPVLDYPAARDLPARPGVSRLSPHLHFGEVGPRQIWRAAHDREAASQRPGALAATESFLRQICWREFAHALLFHFPRTPAEPLKPAFGRFPWRDDKAALAAWQRGQTGHPMVDAGMRELWQTGWMHNRARMIAASFLVKDLLLPWQAGAAWFWDTLVDADLANNTFGWQWAAGCGADAVPFFRIFNPVLQGRKFDPCGGYVRRWIPELARLPDRCIHTPWLADAQTLRAAGVALGGNYPRPIINHAFARNRALAALDSIKNDKMAQ